jgi:hypothetical protein
MSERSVRSSPAGDCHGIVTGHAHDQVSDRGQNATAARSLPRTCPLARHELPVPSQQRVRRDNRRHVTQHRPAEPMRPHGQAPPVVVRQPEAPSIDWAPEQAILFDQIRRSSPVPGDRASRSP